MNYILTAKAICQRESKYQVLLLFNNTSRVPMNMILMILMILMIVLVNMILVILIVILVIIVIINTPSVPMMDLHLESSVDLRK